MRIKTNKKIGISWYIKLNLLVLMFLLVVFLINQMQSMVVRSRLKILFSPPPKLSRPVIIRPVKPPHKKKHGQFILFNSYQPLV